MLHHRKKYQITSSTSTSHPSLFSSTTMSTSNTSTTTISGYNNHQNQNHLYQNKLPNMTLTTTYAAFYVLSGCSQPLIMTLCKEAGLADASTQLYMMFYYLGPASVMIPLLLYNNHNDNHNSATAPDSSWPSTRTILKACGIALWDIMSSSMNYTGAGLAGPTIFAIVYSSVTIWTALYSQLFLNRQMNIYQWLAVLVVFGGLTLTATDTNGEGEDVWRGLLLILVGSNMHALTYVMSEGIMTVGNDKLSIPQNCAVQGLVAFTTFLTWQLVYTVPRWDEKITTPLHATDTSTTTALSILFGFSLANLIHAITFFHTLKHYPGGATSAGVMKGLQAVLVFVFTHFVYCGRMGGDEMCFTKGKLWALMTVSGGVIGYGVATQQRERRGNRTVSYEQIIEAEEEDNIASIDDDGNVEIEQILT